MSDIAIRVDGLGKLYRIGSRQGGYKTFRESLMDALQAPVRRLGALLGGSNGRGQDPEDTIWALKDVSFEVKPGEVVGVIGRNGAGKSTLLKILSRITEPSRGRVEIRGRIGSLLEVGTGFHPELTGRENIFLNGAILGMKKAEIVRRFDEIVAFAEVERFIDTPVKRYSSGMYLRLAFAVAAHLDPEILLVDEVLAVGDAAFQKKCLGKMGDVAREGRTVLLVSHNMSAISLLCPKVILLQAGCLDFHGETGAGIGKYLIQVVNKPVINLREIKENRYGSQKYAKLISLSLFNEKNEPCDTFTMGDSLIAHLEIHCKNLMPNAEVGIRLSSSLGVAVHCFVSTWEGLRMDLSPGMHKFELEIPKLLVYPGNYFLTPWVLREGGRSDSNAMADDAVENMVSISVIGGKITADFSRLALSGSEVYSPCNWQCISS